MSLKKFLWFHRLKRWIRVTLVSTSNDQHFESAFKAFKRELYLRVKEKDSERALAISQLVRSPEYQTSANPYVLRDSITRQYIKSIGDEFISCLEKIIIPNSERITSSSMDLLKQELQRLFLTQLARERETISRLAASLGHQQHINSILPPIQSDFADALSRYTIQLESTVEQANLKFEQQILEANKQMRVEVRREILKKLVWTAIVIIFGLIAWILKAPTWILKRLGITP
ncbi:MAG: hypothetical protein HY707_00270 [Ignavibacteriae bacterium]|nr:hypothetical protein [Ignavibacteriota bacterium]